MSGTTKGSTLMSMSASSHNVSGFFKSALLEYDDANADGTRLLSSSTSLPELASTQGSGSPTSPTPKRRVRQRLPGERWDGKASSAKPQEWREAKWSMEAAYKLRMRNGPQFSMRRQLPSFWPSQPQFPELALRPEKSLDYLAKKNAVASMGFGIGSESFCREQDLPPGPIYNIPSAMTAPWHPTLQNTVKTKFGTEVLPQVEQATPGPGAYSQDGYRRSSRHKTGRKYSIAGREAARDFEMLPADLGAGIQMQGPAPGEFEVAHHRAKGTHPKIEYSFPHFQPNTAVKAKDTDGSGPGGYDVDQVTRGGVFFAPKWTMQGSQPSEWKESANRELLKEVTAKRRADKVQAAGGAEAPEQGDAPAEEEEVAAQEGDASAEAES